MKKIVLLVLIQIFVSFNLFSQYYFYVSTSNERAKPNLNEKGMSNDEVLNQIFKEFEVKSYYQSFPGAKNAELQRFYEIHLTENKNKDFDSFEKLLKNNKIFDAIYRSNYYEPAICSNPVAINDEWIANNWINNDALNLLNAQCAWTITVGDPNIIVGVIDTGFDITHEDLINTFVGGIDTIGPPSSSQHGTYVSSCVAAETNNGKGIAAIGYNTKVKGYHVSSATLWNGIWQAYLDGIKIINVSWAGASGTPANVLAVEEMVDNGVVLVVAAGNNMKTQAGSHQAFANIPGVINVSGVDKNNTHGGTGNAQNGTHVHNQWVDVCALSMGVTGCWQGTYVDFGGTSYAAPQVAGVVALIRSINGNLSPADIENIIKSTTDPITDAHLYQGLLGTGRVNAYKAVQAACATTSSTVNFIGQVVNTDRAVNSCGDLNVQSVNVQNEAKLTLNAVNTITINPPFEVQIGSQLEIK